MNDITELSRRFANRLREQGLGVPNGARAQTVRNFEERYGVQLPAEMLHFFSNTDGMMPDEMDAVHSVRIWPVDEVRPLTNELPTFARDVANAHSAFVFADHLYWSFGYAVWLFPHMTTSTPVFIVGEGSPVEVAPSFGGFLELFLTDSPRLIQKGRGPHQG